MTRKTVKILCAAVLFLAAISSCSKSKTYAEMKEEENATINAFMAGRKVLSEEQFHAQNDSTGPNEWVLNSSSGVYLHIERKGGLHGYQATEGNFQKIKNGEVAEIICRFTEYDLKYYPSIQLTNATVMYSSIPEMMTVYLYSNTFTGSFNAASSLMYTYYSSQSVPSGWLYPLKYINIGRPQTEDEEIAKVSVVVPSAQGQSDASSNVYPCLYEITYERGI